METEFIPTIMEADDYAISRHDERHKNKYDPHCMFCVDQVDVGGEG